MAKARTRHALRHSGNSEGPETSQRIYSPVVGQQPWSVTCGQQTSKWTNGVLPERILKAIADNWPPVAWSSGAGSPPSISPLFPVDQWRAELRLAHGLDFSVVPLVQNLSELHFRRSEYSVLKTWTSVPSLPV